MTSTQQQALPLNSVVNGDCIEVMRNFPSASVDFILTDPPYLVNFHDRGGRSVANDDNDAWLKPAFNQMHRVLRPVWTAEILGSISCTVPELCPHFAILTRPIELQRTPADRRMWTLPWDFSGRHMRSPVSGSALGECNTITSRMLSESGLDFASRFSWITLRSAPKSSLCHRPLT